MMKPITALFYECTAQSNVPNFFVSKILLMDCTTNEKKAVQIFPMYLGPPVKIIMRPSLVTVLLPMKVKSILLATEMVFWILV